MIDTLDWTIVTFTPLLHGWRNYYEADGKTWSEPCPGVLLQERVRDNGERETTVVPARITEGDVIPADWLTKGYVTITTEAQWAQWDHEERSAAGAATAVGR